MRESEIWLLEAAITKIQENYLNAILLLLGKKNYILCVDKVIIIIKFSILDSNVYSKNVKIIH